MKPKTFWSSLLVAVLAIVLSLLGILFPDFGALLLATLLLFAIGHVVFVVTAVLLEVIIE